MSVDGLPEEEVKNRILNDYVKNAPDGYFVYGDPIGGPANLPQIYHYADLLKTLQDSAGVSVVASRVNGVGLIFLAIGISGISSGVAGLDSFRETLLSEMKEVDYGVEPRYYIPELMTMISLKKGITTKLKDIQKSSIAETFRCHCEFCIAPLPEVLTQRQVKMHFLSRRKQEIEELKFIPSDQRIAYIEKRIDAAIQYQKVLQAEKIKVASDFSHLSVWKKVVEKFKQAT